MTGFGCDSGGSMVGGGCGCNGGFSNAAPMFSAPASSGCSSCGGGQFSGAAPVQNTYQSVQSPYQGVPQYQGVQQYQGGQQFQGFQQFQGVQRMPASAPIQTAQPCATGGCPTPVVPFNNGVGTPLQTNSLSPAGDVIPGQVIGDAAATLGGS